MNEFLRSRWDFPIGSGPDPSLRTGDVRSPGSGRLGRDTPLPAAALYCLWRAPQPANKRRPLPSAPLLRPMQSILESFGMYTDYTWVWGGLGFLYGTYALMAATTCAAFAITPVRCCCCCWPAGLRVRCVALALAGPGAAWAGCAHARAVPHFVPAAAWLGRDWSCVPSRPATHTLCRTGKRWPLWRRRSSRAATAPRRQRRAPPPRRPHVPTARAVS